MNRSDKCAAEELEWVVASLRSLLNSRWNQRKTFWSIDEAPKFLPARKESDFDWTLKTKFYYYRNKNVHYVNKWRIWEAALKREHDFIKRREIELKVYCVREVTNT